MKRREALTKILNSIAEVSVNRKYWRKKKLFLFYQDNEMSKEMKQERLEKMIRDELEESNSDRQTPVQSLLASTPGAPGSGHTSQQDKSSRRHSPTSAGGSKY